MFCGEGAMRYEPTCEQWGKLWHRLAPMLGRLGRLRRRLECLGAIPSDPYYRAVCAAFNALHTVCVMTHYASCASGVARPITEDRSDPLLWVGEGI